MRIDFKIQKNSEGAIIDKIVESAYNSPKKAYFMAGTVKESGYTLIEDCIQTLKSKLVFVLGIDKKNTTKSMLEKLLKSTPEIYVYNNNGIEEFYSNYFVFEYSKSAEIIISSTDLSESALKDDFVFYTILNYDLSNVKDKEDYKEFIKKINEETKNEIFVKLSKEYIEELVDKKEIFSTKQYNHNVKSISELLGEKPQKKEEEKVEIAPNKEEIDGIFSSKLNMPKVEFEDSDIEFEGPENYEKIENKEEKISPKVEHKVEKVDKIKKELEKIVNKDDENDDFVDEESPLYDAALKDLNFDENETLDLENILFSKSKVKLKTNEKKSKNDIELKENEDNEPIKKLDEVMQVKKLDLNNVSNIIIELPSRPTSSKEQNVIKIPNYLNDMMPNFLEINEKGKTVDDVKTVKVSVELLDVKNNLKYMDKEARINHKKGQTYVTLETDYLKNISYDEKDIVRIIKLSDNLYHLEVIPKDMQEYRLWSKLCTQKLRSTDRNYGIM